MPKYFLGARVYQPWRLRGWTHFYWSSGPFAARLEVTSEAVETKGFVQALPAIRIPLKDLRKVEAFRSRLLLVPWHRYGIRFYWNWDEDLVFMSPRSSQEQITAALREASVQVAHVGSRWFC